MKDMCYVWCVFDMVNPQVGRIWTGNFATPGYYHITRAEFKPPLALSEQVFPQVDAWLKRHRLFASEGLSFVQGSLDENDHAGLCFLELLITLEKRARKQDQGANGSA